MKRRKFQQRISRRVKRRSAITGKFEAISENEERFTIFIKTHYKTTGAFSSPAVEIPVKQDHRTSEGMHVNVINQNEGIYEIVERGIKVKKI